MEKATELLEECKLQLEYLNEKFGETVTTNSLLSKINYFLKTINLIFQKKVIFLNGMMKNSFVLNLIQEAV